MGKDLKGKELGKGLGQRKDKYYYAKYSYHGKKGQQSFHTLVEAKNWRQEQLYLCRHPELRTATSPDMTVDAWVQPLAEGCRWQPCSEYASELS